MSPPIPESPRRIVNLALEGLLFVEFRRRIDFCIDIPSVSDGVTTVQSRQSNEKICLPIFQES
jgi:hypothetical protein